MYSPPSAVDAAKLELRRSLLEVRKRRTPDERARAAAANSVHLLTALSGAGVVCGYLPLPTEPLDTVVLDALVERGVTVLVPVVTIDAPLDWCRYPVATAQGAFGIAEPIGPRLGPAEVANVDAVVVPALAVDPLGRRLGRGGGHYDRTLTLVPPGRQTELIAVLFDDERVDELPVQEHDVPVTSVVTPTAGWQRLPR